MKSCPSVPRRLLQRPSCHMQILLVRIGQSHASWCMKHLPGGTIAPGTENNVRTNEPVAPSIQNSFAKMLNCTRQHAKRSNPISMKPLSTTHHWNPNVSNRSKKQKNGSTPKAPISCALMQKKTLTPLTKTICQEPAQLPKTGQNDTSRLVGVYKDARFERDAGSSQHHATQQTRTWTECCRA